MFTPKRSERRRPNANYSRKLVQKGLGKARVAVARKLGIRLWIMLRDQIDYEEFCRRERCRLCGDAWNAVGAQSPSG